MPEPIRKALVADVFCLLLTENPELLTSRGSFNQSRVPDLLTLHYEYSYTSTNVTFLKLSDLYPIKFISYLLLLKAVIFHADL